jgi:hypothetical protein
MLPRFWMGALNEKYQNWKRYNINLFKSTAAIYNGKIVETGAKELPLIHMHMNSNLIFDCVSLSILY